MLLQFKMMYTGFKLTSSIPSSDIIAISIKLLEVLIVTVLVEWPSGNDFWVKECKEMSLILKKDLSVGAILCILPKTLASLNLSSSSLKPLEVLLLSARKCSSSVDPRHCRHSSAVDPEYCDITPSETRSFGFFSVWDPFLDYIGGDGAQTLRIVMD